MKSRQKLKGSVLFTVVAVMMVVLVFVMSALTIAGATNRRAYSDYAKAQAQYTARAALDATMASLRDYIEDPSTHELKNNALGKAVAGLSKSSTPIELNVDFLDDANVTDQKVAKDGKVTVSIRCIDDDYVYIDKNTHQVVAVTATVEFAGEKNEETMILLKDPPSSPGKGGSNAVMSLASFSSKTTPIVLGGSGASLLEDMGGEGNSKFTLWDNSGGQMNGSMIINSTLMWKNLDNVNLNKGEGISIFGDYMNTSDGNNLNINDKSGDLGGISSYKEMPYMFISGNMYLCGYRPSVSWDGNVSYPDESNKNADSNGVTAKIGNPVTGSLNIYCKNLYYRGLNDNSQVYADIYIFGDNGTSYIGRQGGGSTKLLNWANTIISPSKVQCGGNILSNGNIIFDGDSYMEKDVLAKKDVTFSKGKIEIGGTLSVGGVLTINDGEVRCNKLEINNIDVLHINGGKLIVNGVEYVSGTDIMEQYRAACENPETTAAANGTILSKTEKTFSDGIKYGGDPIDVKYPNEMTYNELIGLVKDPDSGADLNNDADGDGVGDNKVAILPASSYGRFLDKKDDGTIYYEPAYFKTWSDTVDKNGNAIGGMWRKFYDSENESTANPIATVKSVTDASGKTLPGGVNYILEGNSFPGTIKFSVAKGEEIWVYLKDGLECQADWGNFEIEGGGTVNFFTKKNIILNKTHIATKYYVDKINASGEIELNKNPLNSSEIPNIYIYVDYNELTTIKIDNDNSYITGYIFAPKSVFDSTAGGLRKDVLYHDTDQDVVQNNCRINVIGSVFVGEFNARNDALCVHVSDAGGFTPSGDEATAWAMLSYTAGSGLG